MTPLAVMWSALVLGRLTSISPCPLATNIAAVSFLSRNVGNSRRVLLSGLLYTLGRTVAYVGLGVMVLYLMQFIMTIGEPAGAGGAADARDAAAMLSRKLQVYGPIVLGPVLILVGMLLLGLLEVTASLNLGGQKFQERVAKGGAFWAFPLGVLFALSFCPVSASFFFIGLIGLSTQHSSPVLLPMLFGIGTAVPVIAFAFLIAFASRYVGKTFNMLTQFERWFRIVAGAVFILAGLYYTLTHIYGVRFFG
jgi:cytochrome c biogenesis protein CcdA